MSVDARGVIVRRADLVIWKGRLPGQRSAPHLGMVEGFGLFGGVKISLAAHGTDGDWRTTGVVVSVKAEKLIVIEDVPESPYE